MITTREIDVNLKRANLKHRQVTTKTIDASIRVEPPKEPIKKRGISTTSLPDIADIMEKKRRDDIMAEVKKVEKEKTKREKLEEKKSFAPPTIPPSLEGMIAEEEKKAAVKERMAKVRAAKKSKKK